MISVDKNLNVIPHKLMDKSTIDNLLSEKSEHKVKQGVYAHKDVKDKLVRLYKNKCAYCEVEISYGFKTEDDNYLNIDHFRPKGRIIEDDGHSGYYWLVYEWSNLISSCRKCNIKKSHHFPISNIRVISPQKNIVDWNANYKDYIKEEALLIHPEIDDISDHIYFSRDGFIHHKTPKGKKTIELIDLNDKNRKSGKFKLVLDRKKIIDDFIDRFDDKVEEVLDILSDIAKMAKSSTIDITKLQSNVSKKILESVFKDIFSDLKEASKNTKPFSAFVNSILKDFKNFVIDKFEVSEEKLILEKAYEIIYNR